MKTIAIITGASRGFGRSLARSFVQLCDAEHRHMYLLARNVEGLEQTKHECEKIYDEYKNKGAGDLKISLLRVDFSDLRNLDQIIKPLFDELQKEKHDIERALLIHNAGTEGEVVFTQDLSSPESLQTYMNLNLNSMIWINKRFLTLFGADRDDNAAPEGPPTRKSGSEEKDSVNAVDSNPNAHVIVNVSSLCAVEPFHSMGMYCTAKAARLMHMRIIAKEQSHQQKLQVLNYSPGPMDTDMGANLRTTGTVYQPTQAFFKELLQKGGYVPVDESSKKCINLALQGNYTSGQHIDYYE